MNPWPRLTASKRVTYTDIRVYDLEEALEDLNKNQSLDYVANYDSTTPLVDLIGGCCHALLMLMLELKLLVGSVLTWRVVFAPQAPPSRRCT
jgi:hypothetical protein